MRPQNNSRRAILKRWAAIRCVHPVTASVSIHGVAAAAGEGTGTGKGADDGQGMGVKEMMGVGTGANVGGSCGGGGGNGIGGNPCDEAELAKHMKTTATHTNTTSMVATNFFIVK
jgi:hypothetical protein